MLLFYFVFVFVMLLIYKWKLVFDDYVLLFLLLVFDGVLILNDDLESISVWGVDLDMGDEFEEVVDEEYDDFFMCKFIVMWLENSNVLGFVMVVVSNNKFKIENLVKIEFVDVVKDGGINNNSNNNVVNVVVFGVVGFVMGIFIDNM